MCVCVLRPTKTLVRLRLQQEEGVDSTPAPGQAEISPVLVMEALVLLSVCGLHMYYYSSQQQQSVSLAFAHQVIERGEKRGNVLYLHSTVCPHAMLKRHVR